jgi:hypothetical protein
MPVSFATCASEKPRAVRTARSVVPSVSSPVAAGLLSVVSCAGSIHPP